MVILYGTYSNGGDDMKERRIPLTDEQFERLEEDHLSLDAVSCLLGQAIVEAAEERGKRTAEFWKSVHRIAGDQSNKRRLSVDWVNRCIVESIPEEDVSKEK